MASSLVELQEFKQNNIMNVFSDSCDLQDLLEGLEMPTPPHSPDADETPNCSPQLTNSTQTGNIDLGETILQQMLAYEDLNNLELYGSDDPLINVDPGVPQALLQDCMWSSNEYEPRHSLSFNGVYTPAPSPPPQIKALMEDEETSTTPVTTASETAAVASDPSKPINPKEVFKCVVAPNEVNEEEIASCRNTRPCKMERGGGEPVARKANHRKTYSMSNGCSRVHPQASSSESEEEIDVVTISERPEKPVPGTTATTTTILRKRSNTSISMPSSRNTSPTRLPPPAKRKRCHAKRSQRLSSSGSSYGDSLESDDEQRRASHNVLERKRRNDLKSSFQVLRGQIPELEDNHRAPKVTILKKAADFIKQIREKEDDLQTRLAIEKKRESKLLQRLAYLRSMP